MWYRIHTSRIQQEEARKRNPKEGGKLKQAFKQLVWQDSADTRIVVHLQDALDTGSITCLVRRVGTDAVAITIGKIHALTTNHPAVDI